MGNLKELSTEYRKTASGITNRINFLLQAKKEKNYDEKNVEDRLVILRAERNYLERAASYMEHYYDVQKDISLKGKQKFFELGGERL